MNPDRQPLPLEVARVEWVPATLDSIEVRVFGTWHGSTRPPGTTLLVGASAVPAAAHAPEAGRPPAWSAAFIAPSDVRALLEDGEAALDVGEGTLVALPAAEPGRMDPLAASEERGVVVDPAVLAERRARRAELAEESASARAASAEEAAETLRAQLGHLEERLARAGAERDSLAARVADAERQLRLAEQREEAERRRRAELEEEVADDLRVADASLTELRARLAGAEEVAHALELELAHARRRQEEAERAAQREREARSSLEAELVEARRGGGPEAEARLAELEAALADQERLRAHVADLERRLTEVDADEVARLRAHAADLEARLAGADPDEVARLHARASELERRLAESDSGELAELRAVAEEREAELETLRARAAIADVQATELDALRAQAGAMAEQGAELDALRARIAELEQGDPAEVQTLRARIEELETSGTAVELERLRAHTAALERRLAEPPAPSERELVLAERVASLEAELDRRIEAQERVTSAIATVRDELATMQAQVDAGRAGDATLRAQVAELEERRRALELAVADRERALADVQAAVDQTRAAAAAARTEADEQRDEAAAAQRRVTDLIGELTAERARREAAERRAPAARPELEARLQELAKDLASVRDRLTSKTTELETRLSEERARREAAEAQLAGSPQPPSPAAPAPRPTEPAEDPFTAAEGDALDALVAGLRAEVAAARAHLEALDEPIADAAATPAPGRPPAEAAPPTPAAPAGEPSETEPVVPRGAEPQPRAVPPLADETRERLEAIEAELRAAVPTPGSGVGAKDVIASLQHAADRLRAAAQDELARADAADQRGALPAPPAPEADPSASPPAQQASGSVSPPAPQASAPGSSARGPQGRRELAAAARLTPRPLAPLSDETPWLRHGIERLAASEPGVAAGLVAALLPAQALVVDRLAYDVIVPELGPLRVRIADGAVGVEPVEDRGAPHEVDAVFTGDLEVLARLAAGGAGRWALGVKVLEGRRHVWRLARARRRNVTLADLAQSPQPPDPRLVLGVLANAVEPAWTQGHRFAVEYLVDGDGGWRVTANDGAPLTVDAAGGAGTTVRVSRGALYPVLAGLQIPSGERLTVDGDPTAAQTLHAWFDRARGLAA